MTSTSSSKPVALLFMSLCAFLALRAPVLAQDSASEQEILAPAHTVESYRAKARIYAAKAAAYRKEAERHKEVAKRFREERDAKNRPANSKKDIAEMERHCKAMSNHALMLAKDADLLAAFFESHAKALEAAGKPEGTSEPAPAN